MPFLVIRDRETDPIVISGAAIGAVGSIALGAITGRLRPEIALAAALVAGVAFALARALWRAALKRYAGASG